MEQAKTGIEYSPLSTYSDAGNLKNVNLIAIAIVKREMYQSRKGERTLALSLSLFDRAL